MVRGHDLHLCSELWEDAGGAYTLMKEPLDAHVPPHWMPY